MIEKQAPIDHLVIVRPSGFRCTCGYGSNAITGASGRRMADKHLENIQQIDPTKTRRLVDAREGDIS
jgi:hypothetical protein